MHRIFGAAVLLFLIVGCQAFASDWPDRRGRAPEQMLTDLIEFQQRKHVKESTGELAHECFTDLDFGAFTSAKTPARVAARLAEAPDFHVIANALRAIPAERLVEVLRAARQKARPTWRQMGFIDRQGRGQTEAGHQAELMIADSIVNAFAVDLNVRP